MLKSLDMTLDVYEYTDGPGGDPVSTVNPFDPNANWWTRRRALIPAYGEVVRGQRRDLLFGSRQGEFWQFFLERGLLTPISRPDSDFLRRWLLREPDTDRSWLVDFDPRVFDPPLEHIECYIKRLDPTPINRD